MAQDKQKLQYEKGRKKVSKLSNFDTGDHVLHRVTENVVCKGVEMQPMRTGPYK